jgi:hypothetical protein
MRKIAALAAVLLMAWAAPALANECPTDMKEIDAALAKAPKLSAANLEKVKKWRAEGEALHKAGKHAESIQTLERAKGLLGI